MPFITNYGLYWKAEDVFWGSGGSRGALLGVPSSNTTSTPVDFRDQRGVYVLYADYEIVYVGQNSGQELIRRLIQHQKDDLADRWDRFSWYGVRSVLASGLLSNYNAAVTERMPQVLNHIEAVLIHAAEPPLNRQGGRFGDNVQRYLQYRDDRLGPDIEEMISAIYQRHAKAE